MELKSSNIFIYISIQIQIQCWTGPLWNQLMYLYTMHINLSLYKDGDSTHTLLHHKNKKGT